MTNKGGLIRMANYYLTEMNTVKLENCLLQFIYKEHLTPLLVNGVTSKVIAMMYDKGIDYYYSDLLASAVNVPIKFVDNIYCKNQSKLYTDPLSKLLQTVSNCSVTPEEAKQFEKEVNVILETKKKIHTKTVTTHRQ